MAGTIQGAARRKMNSPPARDKSERRRQLRAAVQGLSAEEIRSASAAAQARLRQTPLWREARAVLFYAPMGVEIDLTPMMSEGLAAGKVVALPRYMSETGAYGVYAIKDFRRDCAPGKFGIAEPSADCSAVELKQLDLALVPGVGFDLTGCRLGRGRGYYDRLLAQFSGRACGVALDPQVGPRIPCERHDARMNFILTPTRWLEIS